MYRFLPVFGLFVKVLCLVELIYDTSSDGDSWSLLLSVERHHPRQLGLCLGKSRLLYVGNDHAIIYKSER